MSAQLRVGLVGAGPWASGVHAPGIAAHPDVELVGVWARRREAAQALADEHGAWVADDPAQLMSRVDAVAFAVPPEAQARLATLAARAGKHVLLEKPIASTVDEAERLADAVGEAGVASLVVLTRRFAPETRDWLAGLHRLGDWRGGNARWLSGAVLGGPYSHSPWRHTDGALADVGPHAVDLLDAALGTVTEVIAAHCGRDDLWHLVLGHEGGASSTISLSLRMPVRPAVIEFSVYGEHGERRLEGRSTPADECYAVVLDDLVAMVAGPDRTHPCDVHRGLHLQRILASARALAED